MSKGFEDEKRIFLKKDVHESMDETSLGVYGTTSSGTKTIEGSINAFADFYYIEKDKLRGKTEPYLLSVTCAEGATNGDVCALLFLFARNYRLKKFE